MGRIIDTELNNELRQVMGADYPRLVQAWMDDARGRMVGLRTALDQQRRTLIQQQAHALKGSSANLGASEVLVLCSELEVAAVEAPLPSLAARLELLSQALERAGAELG